MSPAPTHRNGVRNRPSAMIPALIRASGPVPKDAIWPMAPGSAATHCDTATIQPMPTSISRQNMPSNPNGIASNPSSPAGITSTETTGIAARLASTP